MADLQESKHPSLHPPEGESQEVVMVAAVKRRRRRRTKTEDGEGEARKRKLSDEQVKYLEARFWEERKLESGRKTRLASELGLEPKQVAVWFQNRRARWKCKQMEEEYLKLKLSHDSIVLDKCHLEAEILNLKDQLQEARATIEKLSTGHCGDGNEMIGSPSTSASIEMQQPALEDLVAVQQGDLVCMDEYNYFPIWDLLTPYAI